MSKKNDKITLFRRRVRLLSEVPCSDKFPNCKFICDAHTAQEALPEAIGTVKGLRANSISLIEDIDNLGAENVEDHLNKYDQLLGKLKDTQNEISIFSLEVQNNNTRHTMLLKEVEDLQNQILEYEKNQEIIDNAQNLLNKKNTIVRKIDSTKDNLTTCEEELRQLYVTHGSCEQKLTNLREQKQELGNLREEYAAYDLFMQCMHTGGISYDIIKNKLPIINEEIAKVLANIVDFEVFFEDDGRRLNIFIKHPKHDPRPIEMGSGAEKTIAAMAIRLSLLSVSNLPKSNIFILDEPGTALDAENLEGFIRILEMVKSYFRVVIMISHLDSLKDCVDTVINIDKHDGYAQVNQ
jgi:DNA repair exonuclease SbcCD ATPase subunit